MYFFWNVFEYYNKPFIFFYRSIEGNLTAKKVKYKRRWGGALDVKATKNIPCPRYKQYLISLTKVNTESTTGVLKPFVMVPGMCMVLL